MRSVLFAVMLVLSFAELLILVFGLGQVVAWWRVGRLSELFASDPSPRLIAFQQVAVPTMVVALVWDAWLRRMGRGGD